MGQHFLLAEDKRDATPADRLLTNRIKQLGKESNESRLGFFSSPTQLCLPHRSSIFWAPVKRGRVRRQTERVGAGTIYMPDPAGNKFCSSGERVKVDHLPHDESKHRHHQLHQRKEDDVDTRSSTTTHRKAHTASILSTHTPPALFAFASSSAFKRPRTISPPTSTDENCSESETDPLGVGTPSSETDSSLSEHPRRAAGSVGGGGGSTSAEATSSSGEASLVHGISNGLVVHAHHHTPLRFSFGTTSINSGNSSSEGDMGRGRHSDDRDQAAVDGLITEKMLNIGDSEGNGQGREGEALPSYSESMGQTTETIDMAMDVADVSEGPKMSLKEQMEMVTQSSKQALQPGQSWFLVGRNWYERWSKACSMTLPTKANADDLQLGAVQTLELLEEQQQRGTALDTQQILKRGLEEGIDFELVSGEAWNGLTSWYGLKDPAIERKVIQMPNTETLRIEIYPPLLRLYCVGESSDSFHVQMSVLQTLGDLKKAVLGHLSALFPSAPEHLNVRFWRLPVGAAEAAITASSLQEAGVELISEEKSDEVTLAELQIDQPVELLAVEIKKATSPWASAGEAKSTPSSVKGIFRQDGGDFLSRVSSGKAQAQSDLLTTSVASSSSSSSHGSASGGRVTRSQTAVERKSDKQRGLTGLYNLGNTCFMNAALQCMSNTKELKDYFVSGVYKSEVNPSNPLGMGGAIAKVFGELLTKLWSSSGDAWHPREFKMVLSRFSPQFIGYAQQDTQELLAFLLDGLHEDLNRIVKKPYIEAPDWEGGGMKEMVAFAHRQWEIYKLRNDSVIVDLFQGQYRSTLVCPDCGKVSIKFDPFMYLTLPIPNRKSYVRKVIYIPWGVGKSPTDVDMRFTGETSIGQLKSNLAEWFQADGGRMVACDVFSKSFYRIYGDFENAAEIGQNDVTFIYELPVKLQSRAPLPLATHSYHRREKLESLEANSKDLKKAQADEDVAMLPVFSVAKGSSSSYSHYHSRGGGNAFGQPFFVAIKKEVMQDIDAVQNAVMHQYLQYTSDPAALKRYLQSADDEATSSPEDWDMLNDTPPSLVVPESNNLSEEETVTEIHSDGEAVHVVSSSTAGSSRRHDGRTNKGELSNESLSKTRKARSVSLHFVVHREDQSPLTLKPEGYEEFGEELNARAARLAHAGGGDRDAHGGGDHDMDTDNDGGLNEGKKRKWPLLYTGGALVCVWPEKVKEAVFGTDTDDDWAGGSQRPTFVDPELQAERSASSGAKKGKLTITIEDCLNEFTREEKLGESDPWYCPQCKDFKQATKKFDLWKVPDILVVHLKRFSSGRISRDKIDSFIDFPLHGFDLTNRVEGTKAVSKLHEDEEDDDKLMESIGSLGENDDAVESDAPIYDLYAVDNHYGGLGGGHYTAFAKNPEDEHWYYYDDSSVRPVNNAESEVRGQAAYLLFYRRRTTRPIGGKSREKVRERIKERNVANDDAAHPDRLIRPQDSPVSSTDSSDAGGPSRWINDEEADDTILASPPDAPASVDGLGTGAATGWKALMGEDDDRLPRRRLGSSSSSSSSSNMAHIGGDDEDEEDRLGNGGDGDGGSAGLGFATSPRSEMEGSSSNSSSEVEAALPKADSIHSPPASSS